MDADPLPNPAYASSSPYPAAQYAPPDLNAPPDPCRILGREYLINGRPRYRVTDYHTRGMASFLYRGRVIDDSSWAGRTVMLKVMPRHSEALWFDRPDAIAALTRFRNELKLYDAHLRHTPHEHIVQANGIARDQDVIVLALEFCPFGSLYSHMQRRQKQPLDGYDSGQFSVAEVCAMGWQIADALDLLDVEHGIIHRDIKPENIVVAHLAPWSVKVTDFGISHRPGAGLTVSGDKLGTPDYMSPEQCQGQWATALSDGYALATMLYELLAGHLPYAIPEEEALAMSKAQYLVAMTLRHVNAYGDFPVPDVRDVPGIHYVPALLANLLWANLQREPEARRQLTDRLWSDLGGDPEKRRQYAGQFADILYLCYRKERDDE